MKTKGGRRNDTHGPMPPFWLVEIEEARERETFLLRLGLGGLAEFLHDVGRDDRETDAHSGKNTLTKSRLGLGFHTTRWSGNILLCVCVCTSKK